jgi:hypothetical protein
VVENGFWIVKVSFESFFRTKVTKKQSETKVFFRTKVTKKQSETKVYVFWGVCFGNIKFLKK